MVECEDESIIQSQASEKSNKLHKKAVKGRKFNCNKSHGSSLESIYIIKMEIVNIKLTINYITMYQAP